MKSYLVRYHGVRPGFGHVESETKMHAENIDNLRKRLVNSNAGQYAIFNDGKKGGTQIGVLDVYLPGKGHYRGVGKVTGWKKVNPKTGGI